MRTYLLRPNLVLAIACLLAIGLLLVGMAMPQAHFWGSFLLPIVLVFLWGRRRDIYLVTTLASVLVIATYWTDGPGATGDLLVKHLLPILVPWGVAWLLGQRQQRQEQLVRHKQELEAEGNARAGRLPLLVDASNDAIMSAALDGTILALNKSGEKLMSATAAAVTGRKLAEARLQDANERLQLATEAANMGPTPKS